MLKVVARKFINYATNLRRYQYEKVSKFASGLKNKKILELGSGKPVNGKYYYSTKHLFDSSNTFIQSDVIEGFGHEYIDVTKMKYKDEFDLILCLNVLEHVYKYEKAIQNIHQSLKKKGVAIIVLPAFYPLHDEPSDYWRFTEHSLRKLLKDFKNVNIKHKGKREFPFCYYIEATK